MNVSQCPFPRVYYSNLYFSCLVGGAGPRRWSCPTIATENFHCVKIFCLGLNFDFDSYCTYIGKLIWALACVVVILQIVMNDRFLKYFKAWI